MLAALVASAALGALISAAPVGAATVSLGRIAPMGVTGGCGGCSFLQVSNDPASFSYVVPPGGPWTVVSWSARGGSMPDAARLLIFRPTSTPGRYQLVANSADVPIGVVEAPVNPVSIPVQPGDRIGLRTFGSGDLSAHHPSAFANDVFGGVMGNLMVGETTGPGGTHLLGLNSFDLANVSATLTAPDPVPQGPAKKKCKKKRKKGKGTASSAKKKKKKKKCKKRKRKKKG
jgi:hypothetical protein